MKILQYNCQSFKSNKNNIEFYVNNYDIDICLLSEIFAFDEENPICKLANYNVMFKNRDDGYGGVAICSRKSIKIKKINFNSNYDILIAKTCNLNTNLTIVSTYFPQNILKNDFENEVKKLLKFLEPFDNVIVAGDFNARLKNWGDYTDSVRGKCLFNLIQSTDFICGNNGKFTFKKDLKLSKGSVLDLAFFKTSLLVTWDTIPINFGGSHHNPIIINIMNTQPKPSTFLSKKKLTQNLSNLRLTNDFNMIEAEFATEISNSTFNTEHSRFKPKYWWSSELGPIFRRQIIAKRKLDKNPSPLFFEAFLEARATWDEAVKEAKSKSFNEKISQLNEAPNTKEAWRFVGSLKGKTSKFSHWVDENNKLYLEHLKNQVLDNNMKKFEKINGADNIEFTIDELNEILNRKTSPSAGGKDRVTYYMIRALDPSSKIQLLKALNSQYEKNEIRQSWRNILVVPIPKANKPLDDYRNFRPIALISVFLKTINLMVKERLNKYINCMKILPPRTFAYRKHFSAAMCINELFQNVSYLKSIGNKVVVCVLDISSAYDCVQIVKLREILIKMKIPAQILNWICEFLSERNLCLGKDTVSVCNGLPQGSCLSPLLFNLYTAALHNLEDSNTKIFQFADDFILLSHSRNYDEAVLNLQKKVHQFKIRSSELNLSFNIEKTKTLYFAKNSSLQVNIKIDNVQISQVKNFTFLGRNISDSQTIEQHYSKAIADCSKNANLLKMLTTIKGGLKPKVGLNFYKSFIRSKLEYARTTSAHAPDYIEKKIMTFQNSHLRRCLGCTPSTPYHILYALANELPPKERAIYLTAKEIINTIKYNPDLFKLIVTSPLLKTSYSFVYYKFKQIFENIIVPKSEYVNKDKCSFILDTIPSKKNICSKEAIQAIFAETLNYYINNGYTAVATDASISTDATGCGVLFIAQNHRFYFLVDRKLSSLSGELIAIMKAVELAAEDGFRKLAIFTDSLNACILLKRNSIENHLIESIMELINSKFESVCFIWVPSHVGISYNEKVDDIARQALDVGAPLEISLSPSDALIQIVNTLKKEWNEKYKCRSQNFGKHHFQIFPDIPAKSWFCKDKHKYSKLSAGDFKVLNRLITGHTYDKKYLNMIKVESSNQCDICKTLESAEHLIFKCQKYETIRPKYYFFNLYTNLVELFKSDKTEIYLELIAFLSESKIDI